MFSTATALAPQDRLDVLFEELAELAGQRNAIDGRLVDIVAEIEHDGLCGMTGARSISSLVAWKLGMSSTTANTIATVANRLDEFPTCAQRLREGRLSLDQVGVIATHAADGSDEHYAQIAAVATVNQLRTAIRLEPRPRPEPQPQPEPEPAVDPTSDNEPELQFDPEPGVESDPNSESDVDPESEGAIESKVCHEPEGEPARESQPVPMPPPEAPRSIGKVEGDLSTTYRIVLPHAEAAIFDAALASHTDALVAQWKRDHTTTEGDDQTDGATNTDGSNSSVQVPPFPGRVDGFMSVVQAGWDTDVAARPHGQRTTVVVHLDVEQRVAALHLGPLLSDGDRRFLTCEVWFERHGQVIGSGRETRTVSRRLRRALEHRDRCCVVPGCGATRGLHAHHVRHWEDGGPTDLVNLVLVCPYHHRAHHRGLITISGTAEHLVVTDADGRELRPGSLARPPTTPPPAVPPCRGPTGERADWWWYTPFEPQPPPPTTN